MNNKAVVILSGGMDSATLLYWANAPQTRSRPGYPFAYEVSAVSVNYGQRHSKELDCAKQLCDYLEVQHNVIDLSSLKVLLTGNALTDDMPVPEGHYASPTMKQTVVPNRNMMLLSVAVAAACARDAKTVLYGAHCGDHPIYPDCRREFVQALDKAAQLCWHHEIRIEAPFVDKTKTEVARIGADLGVPFQDTWSCYNGRELHCGKCGTCVERKEAFADSGVTDPTQYEVSE